MSLIVQKYGGSSLADADKIKNVARKILKTRDEGNQVIVIVSAMGDTTDDLISLAKKISPVPPKRELDMLLATGEQVSIALLAMAIEEMGGNAISLTGPQAGIKTDQIYSKAKIVDIVPTRLHEELEHNKIVIVAGFQGMNENNDITTLGRGGSDTTAVAIAAAVKADRCDIYTDVTGVFAADPRIVADIKKIPVISYDEMLELAICGAGVLQPRAVEVAKVHKVKLGVLSSFVETEGTIVQEVTRMEKDVIITGIAHDKDVVKLAVFGVPDAPGTAAKLFSELAENNINIQMIFQSAEEQGINDIAFTVNSDDAVLALEILKKFKTQVDAKGVIMKDEMARVSIVGAGMITHPGVAARMFDILAINGINLEMISTSEINVSVIIKREKCDQAVKLLAKEFKLIND